MADTYDGWNQYYLVCPDCGMAKRLREGYGMMLASPVMKKNLVLKGDCGPEAKAFLETHPDYEMAIKVGCFECDCGCISCRCYVSFRRIHWHGHKDSIRTTAQIPATDDDIVIQEFDRFACEHCGKEQRRIPLSELVRDIDDRRCWECGGRLKLKPDDTVYD